MAVMPIAVKSVLNKCNFTCDYCFQTPESRTDKFSKDDYNLEAILVTMDKLNKKYPKQDILVHGGECTAYPRDDFETMLKRIYELTGKSGIQTNGWKMDEYFDLFKKYKTSLGVSFDGSGEANSLRGFGSSEMRLKQAIKIEENIFKAKEEGIPVSLITIITRINGINHIDKLKGLLLKLKGKGVINGRLNPCTITEDIATKPLYELNINELIKVYDELFDFCIEHGLSYSPFRDIASSLRGAPNVVCVFRGCDIYATPSLMAILSDGSIGNCVKTYRSGPQYLRDKQSRIDIRKQLLKETDCQDCKWFEYCNGGCPNDGIGGDWRRKTKYCALYNHLFHKISAMQETFGIRRKCIPCEKKRISNGIEHLDGDVRHLDSGPITSHTDGITHLDGDVRHEDG